MSMIHRAINRLQPILFGHVLLYHASYKTVPPSLGSKVHNVAPDVLARQAVWLKSHFDVVTIDELLAAEDRRGMAAITFDDGYESVFSEALPRLIELGLPSTVFLIGSSFQGELLWRDVVRSLIAGGHVGDFLEYASRTSPGTDYGTPETFYRMSKHPDVNSAELRVCLTRYFEHAGLPLPPPHLVADAHALVDHPLVTYGNHTQHHLVMSSLNDAQQRSEIMEARDVLQALGQRTSSVFAIPFGGDEDFNDATLRIAAELGYTGCVFSRNRFNRAHGPTRHGLSLGERYTVAPTLEKFQKQMIRIARRTW